MILETNRDLYRAVSELIQAQGKNGATLERYLSALLDLARPCRSQESLTLSDFYQLLAHAFAAEPAAFDVAWQNRNGSAEPSAPYDVWETTLIRQIVDLREMDAAGTLKNDQRYYGINAPRGSRWYNFDPCTYLECAMAGSLGGWEPGDATGRVFVPGEVAVMNTDGTLTTADPQDIARTVAELPQITWDEFTDFIQCGQWYE